MSEQSRELTTINTHKGLFQSRLPYGIAASPAIFQGIMDSIMQGLPQVVWYLDDILISGTFQIAEVWPASCCVPFSKIPYNI